MNHLTEFTRQRPAQATSDYNPDSTVEDWTNPAEIPIHGYFEAQSSTEQYDQVRRQVITVSTLVVPDKSADIRRGDRLKQHENIWVVDGFPTAPVNPFTGWAPGLFVRIREVRG